MTTKRVVRRPKATKKPTTTEIEAGTLVKKRKAVRPKTTTASSGQREVGSEAQLNMTLTPTVDTFVEEKELHEYTDRALFEYGSYVVQDRAVPELRDGLKPSHRAMLWSAVELGLWPSGAFAKSARVVGHAIGSYHPHGDVACYDAGVSIANFNPPLLWGAGNFGTPVDRPAAMRYSEMKLSRFSQLFMADSGYLKAVPYHQNFSEDKKWPVYMPALLPMLLLAGNPTIPAYGVRSGNPSFELAGVAQLTIAALRGRKITARDMLSKLVVQHPYGAECVADEEQLSTLISTGRGSLPYHPQMMADYKRKLIVIQSFSPQVLSNAASVDKTIRSLADMKGVSQVMASGGKKNPDSGPYGCAISITVGRGVGEDEFYNMVQAIRKRLTKNESYQLGVTIRKLGEKSKFSHCDFPAFLNNWVKYRISLEIDYLNYFKQQALDSLHIVNGKLVVVATKDSLDRAIHIIRTAKEPKTALMKEFKLDEAQVEALLSMQLRSLAKLVLDELKNIKAKLVAEIKDYDRRLKEPGQSAAVDLKERLKKYIAKPDQTVSRLPVYTKE